jgi:hypothetical protein
MSVAALWYAALFAKMAALTVSALACASRIASGDEEVGTNARNADSRIAIAKAMRITHRGAGAASR